VGLLLCNCFVGLFVVVFGSDSLKIATGNQAHVEPPPRRAWKPGESAYLGGGFNLRGAAHPRGLQLMPLGNELQIPTTKFERRGDPALNEDDDAAEVESGR
jgi:hypothetical protein